MTWPTDDLTTTHLDADGDSPLSARGEIKALADKLKAVLAEVSAGATVWHSGNDGAGTGLSADLLDGQHGSYYLDPANFTADIPAGLLNSFTNYAIQFAANNGSNPSVAIGRSDTGLEYSATYDEIWLNVSDGTNSWLYTFDDGGYFDAGYGRFSNAGDVSPLPCLRLHISSSAHNTEVLFMSHTKTASTGFDFFECDAVDGQVAHLDGSGQLHLDNGTIATPGDYAEAFEWADGNPESEDRTGQTVTIIENSGGKIGKAGINDDVIGVVSARPVICGDAAPNDWSKKFITDDFGRLIKDENGDLILNPEWEKHIEKIIPKIKVTDDIKTLLEHELRSEFKQVLNNKKEINKNKLKIEFEKFKKENEKGILEKLIRREAIKSYVPRLSRPEWDAIGLVGKLWVKPDQHVNPNWILLEEKENGLKRYLVR